MFKKNKEEFDKLSNKEKKDIYDKKIKRMSKLSILFEALLLTTILIAILVISNYFRPKKEFITVTDLSNLPAPIQKDISKTFSKKIDGYDIQIDAIASYTLSGRIVRTYDYYSPKVSELLSPKDIGIVWGDLAKDENLSKFKWDHNGGRTLYTYCYDNLWLADKGGKEYLSSHMSHNHLIPSNYKQRNLIDKLSKNDYVQIDGYLVNVTFYKDGKKTSYWDSSLVRYDKGCELIYVTDIKWLKE